MTFTPFQESCSIPVKGPDAPGFLGKAKNPEFSGKLKNPVAVGCATYLEEQIRSTYQDPSRRLKCGCREFANFSAVAIQPPLLLRGLPGLVSGLLGPETYNSGVAYSPPGGDFLGPPAPLGSSQEVIWFRLWRLGSSHRLGSLVFGLVCRDLHL
jgi:hypothetical protein